MSEIWKDVVGYEGFYQVSNMGRVKSLDRVIDCADGHKRRFKGQVLKTMISATGYPIVNLRRKSSLHTASIHSLVARAFIGERPYGYHTDHIDRDRTNSVLSNLRYIHHTENEAQGSEKQRKPVAQILDGETVATFIGINDASRRTGIKASDICRTCKGIRNTAGGYHWRYI